MIILHPYLIARCWIGPQTISRVPPQTVSNGWCLTINVWGQDHVFFFFFFFFFFVCVCVCGFRSSLIPLLGFITVHLIICVSQCGRGLACRPNIYTHIYIETEISAQKRSRRDRESNHGLPACRADVLTITPSRFFRRWTSVLTFINLTSMFIVATLSLPPFHLRFCLLPTRRLPFYYFI